MQDMLQRSFVAMLAVQYRLGLITVQCRPRLLSGRSSEVNYTPRPFSRAVLENWRKYLKTERAANMFKGNCMVWWGKWQLTSLPASSAACWTIEMSPRTSILWHVDPLLGNDREISNSSNKHVSSVSISLEQRNDVFYAVDDDDAG
jgi:hypothetical protein